MSLWNTHGYQNYLKKTKQGFNKKSFIKFLKNTSKGETLADAIEELYWQNMVLAATINGIILILDKQKKEKNKGVKND